MQRINDREVELTHREVIAKDFFEELLDDGLNIPDAAEEVAKFGRRTTPYDPDFLDYLRT